MQLYNGSTTYNWSVLELLTRTRKKYVSQILHTVSTPMIDAYQENYHGDSHCNIERQLVIKHLLNYREEKHTSQGRSREKEEC